ncbi:MAG: hypothetical protein M1834_005612 [Cirrosporium novae-zelandiae]|nr:MAG: hypothetical protein M1834_005612 [Cirrosporium novae-zelandiae]
MEGVQGVDVSWLHHSCKEAVPRSDSPSPRLEPNHKEPATSPTPSPLASPPLVASPPNGAASPPPQPTANSRPHPITRTNSDRPPNTNSKPKSMSRRNSWISSISQRFSSTPAPRPQNPATDHSNNQKSQTKNTSPPDPNVNPFGAAVSPAVHQEEKKETASSQQQPAKSHPGFFQSAFRRLSSSGVGGLGRSASTGSVCTRKVMNVDPYRDRCKVADLESAKLRRVAFCVDVEIASTPRYPAEEEAPQPPPERRPSLEALEHAVEIKKKKSAEQKRKGEGEALKHPEEVAKSKEQNGVVKGETLTKEESERNQSQVEIDMEALKRKREKKKQNEGARKERRERRRRLAEANGTVPLELTLELDSSSSSSPSGTATPNAQDKPTTDPLRIYRRCCQLRETPVLKKIVEEVTAPSSVLAEAPGTVGCLNLSNYTIKLNDCITMGDWLAVVPVRKLILDNCGLTDEAIRIILAALLAVKTMEQARHNKTLAKKKGTESEDAEEEKLGVVETLSLKNNPKIGPEGWRYIAFFIYMSRTLKAIDLSGIPFPQPPSNPSHGPGHLMRTMSGHQVPPCLMSIFSKALGERLAWNQLEQLVIGECNLSAECIGKIADGAIQCKLRRLGLANNHLDHKGLEHVARYVAAGYCEGLDLGGNDIPQNLPTLIDVLHEDSSLVALSLAECNLSQGSLLPLFPALMKLPNIRFLDLSHNRNLFATQPDALSLLRKYLPLMPSLKRIHLHDVDMSPDHAIALAEILPECGGLCHIGLLENKALVALADAKDEASQEEACALYASLMVAVRVSNSIICIDIEVPSQESSEIVKALAKQLVAYSLRNLERATLAESWMNLPHAGDNFPLPKEVEVPDVLLHLIGPADGTDASSEDELAPDDDYVIGGTGVVKALGICLGSAHNHSRRPSRDGTPTGSGTITPRNPLSSVARGRARDVSKDLLGSARKIRSRIQIALVREDRAGNDLNYRRLQFLDSTLKRIIERFEDEYPETRIPDPLDVPGIAPDSVSDHGSSEDTSLNSGKKSEDAAGGSPMFHEDDEGMIIHPLSRRNSDVSIASRALTTEEGQMHRFGQKMRRDILRPQMHDHLHGTTGDEEDLLHIAALRERLETLSGAEIRSMVDKDGVKGVLTQLGATVEELITLKKEDPAGLEKLKAAQLTALLNIGTSNKANGDDESAAEDITT